MLGGDPTIVLFITMLLLLPRFEQDAVRDRRELTGDRVDHRVLHPVEVDAVAVARPGVDRSGFAA